MAKCMLFTKELFDNLSSLILIDLFILSLQFTQVVKTDMRNDLFISIPCGLQCVYTVRVWFSDCSAVILGIKRGLRYRSS